jgi:ribonuclease P protein component
MVSLSCFSRQARLLHSHEFQRVFNNTECKSADALLTVLAVRNDCGHPRLGLAISKKRIKTAVARNRLKRLIRESFRQHKNELANVDIVVLGQTRVVGVSNKTAVECLETHWKNITKRCKKLSSQSFEVTST